MSGRCLARIIETSAAGPPSDPHLRTSTKSPYLVPRRARGLQDLLLTTLILASDVFSFSPAPAEPERSVPVRDAPRSRIR
jgi:hypothetical protein